MSRKSAMTKGKDSPYYKTHKKREEIAAKKAEALAKSKNHVSEKDLSPGGFPFHFAGPKKKKGKK